VGVGFLVSEEEVSPDAVVNGLSMIPKVRPQKEKARL
jgi:hypothetical protein